MKKERIKNELPARKIEEDLACSQAGYRIDNNGVAASPTTMLTSPHLTSHVV
jgi:hypothetical protein